MRSTWSEDNVTELRRLWHEHGGGIDRIAKSMGRSRGSISGKSLKLGLQFHGGRAKVLDDQHPAIREGRTLFRHRVHTATLGVLKSGANQRKLGDVVEKGKWRGFPIYSLTLEERATCPRSCIVYNSCYGNNSSMAKRYRHGIALERAIVADLVRLQELHPRGFVVRLHQLGDFYSVAYVDFWADRLDEFPALHVFGYCARQLDDVIGERVIALREFAWDRFAVRTSGAKTGPRTMVIDIPESAPDAIVCPAQTERTRNCSTCGLCWTEAAMHRPIAFLQH